MNMQPLSVNEKALVGFNILAVSAFVGLVPFIRPDVWYEPVIAAETQTITMEQTTQNRVFVVDAEIPSHYDPLNVIVSVDFTGEGFLGNECGNSHGVMVANVIGHTKIGVNPNAQIVGVKVFPCDSETPPKRGAFATAIRWIEENSTAGDIINLSLTATSERSIIVENTLQRLTEKGVIVVSSAGNTAGDSICDKAYGATVEGAHVISGTQPKGIIKNNFEKVEEFADGECVTGYLPGVEIQTYDINLNKVVTEGTSFSAAFKTGILSLGG